MTQCTHSRTITVDNGYEDWDGNWQSQWEESEEGTWQDIDLHRFKCTQCGKVRYYSNAAREHFEGTKPDPWIDETNARYLAKQRSKADA